MRAAALGVVAAAAAGAWLFKKRGKSVEETTDEQLIEATVNGADAPSAAITARSPRVTVRIEPKRNWMRVTVNAPAADTSTTPPAIPV